MKTLYDFPKLMREAHARARADFAWARQNARNPKPYSYYLGLQMHGGFAEQRELITGGVPRLPDPRAGPLGRLFAEIKER